MKLRFFAAVALAAIAIVPAGARATATVNNDVLQAYSFNSWNPNTGSNLNFTMVRQRDVESTSTDLGWSVSAYEFGCNINGCFAKQFNPQPVSAFLASFDPAGNSGSIQAVLVGTNELNQSIAGQFNLTFTRPRTIGYCLACALPNAWVDPNNPTVGGNVDAFIGLNRTGYTIAGTFAGSPYAGNYAMDYYTTSLIAQNSVTLP